MILFIDDSTNMGYFYEGLKSENIETLWSGNFHDARYALAIDPGERFFQAIILDLHMSTKGLPREEKVLDLAEKVYSGWVFYEYVLKDYPDLKDKTIFLSGFPENFEEKIGREEYSKLNIVRKGPNDIEDVQNILQKLGIYK